MYIQMLIYNQKEGESGNELRKEKVNTMKEIKLTSGIIRISAYQSNINIDIFDYDKDNNEAIDSMTIYADNCHDFTTEENIEESILRLSDLISLTSEDEEKLKDELQEYIYSFSSEIRS